MSREYVDNAYNRAAGRVGFPRGSAVISKNTVCGINTKTYVDNAYNSKVDRVGERHGSAVISKYSDEKIRWNYLDERDVCQKTGYGYTKHALDRSRDMQHARRESDIADLCLQDRSKVSVSNRWERWSSSSESESGAEMERIPRNKDSVPNSRDSRRPNSKKSELGADIEILDRDLHEIVTCHICKTNMESSSLTPCGHHFCTYCIRQRLKRKQTCPVCRTSVRGSELIRDKEFDRIVENTQSQEAIQRETEDKYRQLARQFKEKSQQNQKQKEQHGRNTFLEEELAVIQKLQHYYDRKFRNNSAITERMMHVLIDKTDAVDDKTSERTDIGDGLVELVWNYTSLIKENASLRKTAIECEEEQKRLKRKLHHSEARIQELERKYQSDSTLSEE